MIEKIKTDIIERSMRHNHTPMQQTSSSQQEYDYRYYTSSIPSLKDYTFVVSKFISYKASSMDDFGRNVYIYDKEGNFINDRDIQKQCKGDFFLTLNEI
jgi:hypothetical protein